MKDEQSYTATKWTETSDKPVIVLAFDEVRQVYKVVYKWQNIHDSYSSTFATREFMTHYYVNTWTYPRIGGLFAFSDMLSAAWYLENVMQGNVLDTRIFLADAVLSVVQPKYVARTQNGFHEFWKNDQWKEENLPADGTTVPFYLQPAFSGTVICDAIRIREDFTEQAMRRWQQI